MYAYSNGKMIISNHTQFSYLHSFNFKINDILKQDSHKFVNKQLLTKSLMKIKCYFKQALKSINDMSVISNDYA
jgi:hypothetical protein